jgi:hypothetical protein
MMWNPPIALTSEEQKRAARTRKTRKFFVLLREHRHALLDADFQPILAQSSRPESGCQEPVDAGLLALATLLQAYGHVGDRDAVELSVLDTRWPLVRDGLGAEPPPCSQGPLCTVRRRRIAHHLDKTLLDRPVALAEHTGGCGARPRRAVRDSPPLCGAGRVEDTLHWLGHALRQAVGLAAHELGTAAGAVVEAAGLTLGGHRSLKAALDRDGGEPSARARALGLGLEEVARGPYGLEPPHSLAGQAPPLQAVMETITPLITQETAPDPEGGPGGRRIKKHVAPARRLSLEDTDRRHGRTRSAKTFQGSRSTWRSIGRAPSSGRWGSARRTSQSMKRWHCWPRRWSTLPACCSSLATWGPWPAPGWPNGRNRACPVSLVPGLQVVRWARSMIASWPWPVGKEPVRVANPARWSQARRSRFRRRRVTRVPCAPSARKPRAGMADA